MLCFNLAIVLENRFESLENSLKIQVMLGSNLENLKSNGCVDQIEIAIFFFVNYGMRENIEISITPDH